MRRTLPAVVVCCPSDELGRTEVCSCSDPGLRTKSTFKGNDNANVNVITKVLKRN